MWASTSSHADCPEGNDDTIVQDCRRGYHGTDALAGWPGSVGAEIGRHPQDAGFRQSPPFLFVAQNVPSGMERARGNLAGLLTRGSLFWSRRSLFDLFSAKANAAAL